MADRRPGGIDKIAHLFVTGQGPSAIQSTNGSSRRWTGHSPVQAPKVPAPGSVGAAGPGGTASASEPATPPAGPAPAGEAARAAEEPARPPVGPTAEAIEALFRRAQTVAVLSSHLGPLAGPAAEACARILAGRQGRVAMLYGPADLACLHCFSAQNGLQGHGRGNGDAAAAPRLTDPCEALLLPDWVFQSDLCPPRRSDMQVCLAYGAGSQGLMAAYGALKGLVTRFGEPEQLLIVPFGCDAHEEQWGRGRLVEMCRRFLRIEPGFAREGDCDVHVQASSLMAIPGGTEGVKRLLHSIGPRLTIIEHVEPPRSRPERREMPQGQEGSQDDDRASPHEGDDVPPQARPPRLREEVPMHYRTIDPAIDEVTPLVSVPRVPAHGEDVLQALLHHEQLDAGAALDVWRRGSPAGTVVGQTGYIGATADGGDLLALALWLSRQARSAGFDGLEEVVIAVKRPDAWLIEASMEMPVPVRWLAWRPFSLDGRLGVAFEPIGHEDEG